MNYNAHMKTDPVPILTHALAVEGSATKLAAAMHVTPAAVTHWKTRGLPLHVASELVRRYAKRRIPKDPRDWQPTIKPTQANQEQDR